MPRSWCAKRLLRGCLGPRGSAEEPGWAHRSSCLPGQGFSGVRYGGAVRGSYWQLPLPHVGPLSPPGHPCTRPGTVLHHERPVPPSSPGWVPGPPEGSHQEGPELAGRGWHDPHAMGCLPRQPGRPAPHRQQRVSGGNTWCWAGGRGWDPSFPLLCLHVSVGAGAPQNDGFCPECHPPRPPCWYFSLPVVL